MAIDSSRVTTTISPISRHSSKHSRARARQGIPPTGANCLSIPSIRLALPAATTMADTKGRFSPTAHPSSKRKKEAAQPAAKGRLKTLLYA